MLSEGTKLLEERAKKKYGEGLGSVDLTKVLAHLIFEARVSNGGEYFGGAEEDWKKAEKWKEELDMLISIGYDGVTKQIDKEKIKEAERILELEIQIKNKEISVDDFIEYMQFKNDIKGEIKYGIFGFNFDFEVNENLEFNIKNKDIKEIKLIEFSRVDDALVIKSKKKKDCIEIFNYFELKRKAKEKGEDFSVKLTIGKDLDFCYNLCEFAKINDLMNPMGKVPNRKFKNRISK